jgi:hypothetical protein
MLSARNFKSPSTLNSFFGNVKLSRTSFTFFGFATPFAPLVPSAFAVLTDFAGAALVGALILNLVSTFTVLATAEFKAGLVTALAVAVLVRTFEAGLVTGLAELIVALVVFETEEIAVDMFCPLKVKIGN